MKPAHGLSRALNSILGSRTEPNHSAEPINHLQGNSSNRIIEYLCFLANAYASAHLLDCHTAASAPRSRVPSTVAQL
jgi:hypothetical protein